MRFRYPLSVIATLTYVVWGMLYVFPIYLPVLKNLFDLSQVEINWLGSGIYLSCVMIGVPIAQVITTSLGSKYTILSGAVLSTLGYLFFYLTVKLVLPGRLPLLILYSSMIGISVGIYFNGLLFICLPEFDSDRQHFIINIGSAAFSIGGTVASLLYLFVLTDVESLFLFLCITHAVAGGISTIFVILFHKDTPSGAVSKSVNSIDETLISDTKDGDDDGTSGGSLAEFSKAFFGSKRTLLIITIMIFKVGIGTTFTTNLGSLSDSLSPAGDLNFTVRMIIYFSIAQMVGRGVLVLGSTETFLKFMLGRRYQTDPSEPKANPTLFYVGLIGVAYTAIFVWAIIDISTDSLPAVTVCFGIFYGAMWSVSGSLVYYTSQPDHQYSFTFLFPLTGLGTVVLNFVTGYLYDANSGRTNFCFGSHCYRSSWGILLALSIAIVVASVLVFLLWIARPRGVKRVATSQVH